MGEKVLAETTTSHAKVGTGWDRTA